MLVSHSHRFIYLKTVKTASTSVEALLEPLCCPPGYDVTGITEESVTEYGIVGRRGPKDPHSGAIYRNHMSAQEVKMLLPDEFAAYIKIANVRDPYEKCISNFHMRTETTPTEASALAIEAPEELRSRFTARLSQQMPKDQALLLIDGEFIIDRIVRFEHLLTDLEKLDRDLGLGLGDIADKLPSFKLTNRATAGPPTRAYLSPAAIRTINHAFRWYFDQFGYQRLDPESAEV